MSFAVDIRKRLGRFELTLAFNTGGGLTALFGPSGAGKTSLLNMVAGTLKPDAGRIAVGDATLFDDAAGIDVPPEQRRAGYIFQDGRLFPHLSVRSNLLYGWRLTRPEARSLKPADVIDLLGVGHLLDRRPATLSGGEAQRIAIGRALLASPRFLLMDEPLSSLDRARKEEIMRLIEHLRDELRLPILYVTHDEREVDRLADTRIELDLPET